MKKIICLFLVSFLFNCTFTQNFDKDGNIIDLSGLFYREDIIKEFAFKDNTLVFWDLNSGREENSYVIKSYDFTYENINNLTFLLLDNKESLLCLANEDMCILYDKNSNNPLCIGTHFTELQSFLRKENITASSELIEGKTVYGAGNLANLALSSPWVEASKGYGIGDYIIFEPNCSHLYFLNGYVSFEKPYLYTANSRVKKIKLSFLDAPDQQPMIVEIKDTPNPQKISFGFRSKGKIKMEILEVYPGEKYQDTCINGIFLKIY